MAVMKRFQFHPYQVHYLYRDPVDRQRAQWVLSINVVLCAMLTIVFVVVGAFLNLLPPVIASIIGVFYVLVGLNIVLVQTGRLRLASYLIVGFLIVSASVNIFGLGRGATAALAAALAIMAAAALLGRAEAALTTAIGVALFVVGAVLEARGVLLMQSSFKMETQPIFVVGMLVVSMLFQRLFSGGLEQSLRRSVNTAARLRATAEVSKAIGEPRPLDELLRRTVAMIREQFGFYHVQVFLLDDERAYAALRASTGRVGRRLLTAGHRLGVGSRSVVGRAAALNEAVLADSTDPIYQPNPLLPDTRTELALPLQTGESLIGVLDVQSTDRDAFTPEDITGLQTLANQLAVTVGRIHSLEETQRHLDERERLLTETQARLAEVERLNRRLTGQAWQGYLSGRGEETVGFDWEAGELHERHVWSSGLSAVMGTREMSLRREGDRQVLALPIVLRDTALGAVELSGDGVNWDQNAQELAQEVVNRLAIALDSARLFEDSQRLAERERLMNEVTARLQGASDMPGMLALAAQEIRQALKARAVTVRFGGVDGQAGGLGNGHGAE